MFSTYGVVFSVVLMACACARAEEHIAADGAELPVIASDVPRGVMRAHVDAYAAGQKQFRCLDGSKTVPFTAVNDEFCDCADGSDEPGTAACSWEVRDAAKTWRFRCADSGSRLKDRHFRHSRVNDGICDCCDGSDEYAGHVTCENRCAALAQAEGREQAARAEKRRLGLEAKKIMVSKAAGKVAALKEALAEDEAKVVALQARLEEVAPKKDAAEAVERVERDAIRKKSEEGRDAWQRERDERLAQMPAKLGLRCLHWAQTADCRGDGDVEGTNRTCEEHIAGSASGFCACARVSEEGAAEGAAEEEVLIRRDCGHEEFTCAELCDHGTEGHIKAHKESYVVDHGDGHEHDEAKQHREEHNRIYQERLAADAKVADAKRQLEKLQDASIDPAFHAMAGECYEKPTRDYTYRVCPFDKAEQAHTSLGTWKGFGEQTYSSWGAKHDLSRMIFEGGQHCWGGPARSATVQVVCGPSNELMTVDEPSMCTYKMVLQSPAICE